MTNQKDLEELQAELVKDLKNQLQGGTATAADRSVVVALLKHHNIQIGKDSAAERELEEALNARRQAKEARRKSLLEATDTQLKGMLQ